MRVKILETPDHQHVPLETALGAKGHNVIRVALGDDLIQELRPDVIDAAIVDGTTLRRNVLANLKRDISSQTGVPVIVLGAPGSWQQTHEIIMPADRSPEKQRQVGQLLVTIDGLRLA
jgi:DNA-binding NtrC family response regulator